MEYGDLGQNVDKISLYLGVEAGNANPTFPANSIWSAENGLDSGVQSINQRDADMIHLWSKVFNLRSMNSRLLRIWNLIVFRSLSRILVICEKYEWVGRFWEILGRERCKA